MEQFIHTLSSEPDIKTMDSAISRVFDSISPNPLLRSPTVVTNLVFTASTDLIVSHKLNRIPIGYILVGSTASSTLYTSPTSNPNKKTQIILRTSANTTANVLFF